MSILSAWWRRIRCTHSSRSTEFQALRWMTELLAGRITLAEYAKTPSATITRCLDCGREVRS